MNSENAHITLPCPNCSQNVATTLAELRESPIVTCGACGHEFYADVGPLMEAAQE